MEPRGMKRKRYAEMKNDLSLELHKLTNASGDFNNDLHGATQDFEAMCKRVADRQSDFISRSVVIEEQYREAMAVLTEKQTQNTGEASGENVVLPTGYSEDVRRFVADAGVSLNGHGKFVKEELAEMERNFDKYQKLWMDNLKAMKEREDSIAEQRREFCTKLHQFSRIKVEDSGDDLSDEGTDEEED